MAQLELAHLPSATGATNKAIGMGTTVETDGGAVAKPVSFSWLLRADAPENPVAAVSAGLATGTAAPVTANPPVAQAGLEVVDPADLGKAGEQLMIAALTEGLAEGLARAAGADESGESRESASETGASDSDTATGEMEVEAPWLGLPLFIDARAALRNVGSAGVETATSTASVDSARLRLMLCSPTASGRLADGGRRSARLTGEPVSEALAGARMASTAPSAVAAVIGLPAPGEPVSEALAGVGIASTVRAASGDTMAKPSDGSAAGLMQGLKAAQAADSITVAGAVPPAAAGVSAAVDAEGSVAVGQVSGAEMRPVAPGIKPLPAPAANAAPGVAALIEDEGVAPGRISTAGARPSAQPTGGHPLQWHPRLAESLARAEAELPATAQSASTGNAGTIDEASRTTMAAAVKIVEDTGQSLPSAARTPSPLSMPGQANWRSPDAVAALATAPPEEALVDMAAIRAGEPIAPANGGTPTQAGSSSAASVVRPDGSTASASLPTTPEVLNLNQKNWERTLGHQLNWMVNNRLQEAEIKVNPPDLGPLEVRVSLHHNQTSVTFFSHEAAVREALENALPRLREMLDGQGINLGQAQVSDQSLARQQAGAGGEQQSPYGQRAGGLQADAPGSEATADAAESRPPRSRSLLGTVDDYA